MNTKASLIFQRGFFLHYFEQKKVMPKNQASPNKREVLNESLTIKRNINP